VHAAQGIEARAGHVAADLHEAGVHHVADAVDRHRGLGDVGREDHLVVMGWGLVALDRWSKKGKVGR
jgi:hypothetical protein